MSTVTDPNPYTERFSTYSKVDNGRLVYVNRPEVAVFGEAADAHKAFQQHVLNSEFPCLGAKASLHGNFYRYGFYGQIGSPGATLGLAHDLWTYAREQVSFETNYATFVACFAGPKILGEGAWESVLWRQLQNLSEADDAEWDPSVSRDPDDAHFSFSFAGTGFFIVGLHQEASRLSRQFRWPTMVFNVHAQFQRLRDEGTFERLQATIRARDLKLQGSVNPNLSNFGEQSEAKQYSGRAVEPEWKCPFHKFFSRFVKKPH